MTMNLKDFVQQTIEQIVDGVKASQESVGRHGAKINPKHSQFQANGQWHSYNSDMTRDVEFDVALTTIEGKGSAGGIGVFLGPASLGTKGESSQQQTAVSRVKFTVPLVLPEGGGNVTEGEGG